MTTAHRPTWKAAVGKAQEGGWTAGGSTSSQISSLDLASHTKLKIRRGEQIVDKKASLRESIRKLEEAERKAPPLKFRRDLLKRPIIPRIEEEGRLKLLKQTAEVDMDAITAKYDDADEGDGGGGHGGDKDDDSSEGWKEARGEKTRKRRNDHDNKKDDDAATAADDDDHSDLDASSSDTDDSDDDDDDDDSDDDEEALQAELEKIRAEREEAKRRLETAAAEEEESKMEESAMIGNPLLNGGIGGGGMIATGRMKRRWNDDVVFRNQAKGEPKIAKRFINDTVRNDFHKRFLNKFIR